MIAHIDADAFFASVLQRLHPHLRGKPLFALGMGGSFIIAASYEAKAKGVKTGMPINEARKLCPGAVEMPSDFRETGLASEQIEMVLTHLCPCIEQMSIDEWYVDMRTLVGGVPSDTWSWGEQLRKTVLQKTGLSVSVGIAPTKTLAKLAGETRKPAGVTVVQGAELEAFLRTRPLEAVCGIGSKRSVPGRAQGWRTAWDMASADPALVRRLFGKTGLELQAELRGIVQYPVEDDTAPPKSISRTRSFRATGDGALLWSHLLSHLSRTVLRMRRHRLAATHLHVWLRTADYAWQGTGLRLLTPCDDEAGLLQPVSACFDALHKPQSRYTQAGMALSGLVHAGSRQQSLFEAPEEGRKDTDLQRALDRVRDRFGKETITRAAALPLLSGERPGLGISVSIPSDNPLVRSTPVSW